MENNTLENGKIIKNMGKELLHGQMEENMLGNGKIIKNMDKEFLLANLAKNMKGNFHKAYTTDKAHTRFVMEDSTLENG